VLAGVTGSVTVVAAAVDVLPPPKVTVTVYGPWFA